MSWWRLLASLCSVALVAAYVIGSTRWVSASPGWYAGLARPAWQPPDAVFAIIWPYNFVALAVVGVLVAQRADAGAVAAWLAVGVASVMCALLWAYLFYVPHLMIAASVALAAASLLTAVLVGIAWAVTRGGAAALAPYLVWVSLATTLAVGYARLNPSG